MSDSLASIKKQLQEFGVSTITPGLAGEERYEELLYRLAVAKKKLDDKFSNNVVNDDDKYIATSAAESSNNSRGIHALNSLEFSEIRARLVALGESTSTPGLVGEERKNELLRRLTQSICGSDDAVSQVEPSEKYISPRLPLQSTPRQNISNQIQVECFILLFSRVSADYITFHF